MELLFKKFDSFGSLYLQFNLIDLYKNPIPNTSVCNVQKSPNLAPGITPPLPNSRDLLHFLRNLFFQYSDFNDSEYIQFCKIRVEKKAQLCYKS